jgi:hypothetical protein
MRGSIRGDNERCPAEVFSSSQWPVPIIEASLELTLTAASSTRKRDSKPPSSLHLLSSPITRITCTQTRVIPEHCLNCSCALPWAPLTRSTFNTRPPFRKQCHKSDAPRDRWHVSTRLQVVEWGCQSSSTTKVVVRRGNEKWSGTRDTTLDE